MEQLWTDGSARTQAAQQASQEQTEVYVERRIKAVGSAIRQLIMLALALSHAHTY